MYNHQAYLLHPQNQNFLEEKKQYPHNIDNPIDNFAAIILVMVPLFIISVGLAYVLYEAIAKDMQINQNGTITQGFIQAIDTNGGNDRYCLHYDFYVDNIRYTNCSFVEKNTIEQYQIGDSIEIIYATANPMLSHLTDVKEPILGMFGLLIVSIVAGGYLIIRIISTFKYSMRNYLLRKRGKKIIGKIVLLEEHHVGHDYFLNITVSFQTPDTGNFITESKRYNCNHLREEGLGLPRLTSPIYILYVDKKMWEVL